MLFENGGTRKRQGVFVATADPNVRLRARERLEGMGLAVRDAQSAEAALESIRADPPDAVLLDAELPGPNGFEVLERLRAERGDESLSAIPVLMLSGAEDLESIRSAYQAGATDFACKPLDWRVLGERVAYLLRAQRVLTELRRSQLRLNLAQRVARLGNWELDVDSSAFLGSATYRELYGLPSREGLSLERVLAQVHEQDRDRVREALERSIETGEGFCVDHRLRPCDDEDRILQLSGNVFFEDRAEGCRVEGIAQDVTERRGDEEKAHYLAYHDGLTGLGNQRLFRARIEDALAAAREKSGIVALLFIDLDHFKRVNDTLGHARGDELIREASTRLAAAVRAKDSVSRRSEEEARQKVSRLGGDEFTLLLPEITEADNARAVARRILRSFERPFQLGGREVVIGVSVGVALHPEDGDDAESLIRNADAAMYNAKQQGRNNFQFYSESMNRDAVKRFELETKLRQAVEDDRLEVFFQPRASLESGRITGMEALARWTDPELGVVPPSLFVAVAEEIGLARMFGAGILRLACAQAQRWAESGQDLVLSVNVSPNQLNDPRFPEAVLDALERTGFPAQRLELEIRETALIYHKDTVSAVLDEVKRLGVSIALDDFGTGFSSLNHLTGFPIDAVKIDRSFISGLGAEEGGGLIPRAIISMAKPLGLRLVAVGVETEEQRALLATLGCDEEQGYRISPPLQADRFYRFLLESASG